MRLLQSIGGTGRTRVLLSVLRLHDLYGRVTVRAVAADIGCTVSVAHWHLNRLRDEGLVAWDDGTQGSLRPLVREVAL